MSFPSVLLVAKAAMPSCRFNECLIGLLKNSEETHGWKTPSFSATTG